MDSHKNIIVFSTMIVMFLCFMTGCAKKPSNSQVISAVELKEFMSNGRITLIAGSGGACKAWMVPKNQKVVLSIVVNWLKQAEPYKGETPQPAPGLSMGGDSGPTELGIYTSDKDIYIEIEPAVSFTNVKGKPYSYHLVKNVIRLYNDRQISYIESKQLYNYLESNKWKRDFKNK